MFTLQEATADGVRPNWKNIGILIAIVAVIGALVFFATTQLNRGGAITYRELEQEAQVSGVAVKISVAPEVKDTIKIVFQIKESDLKYGFLSGDGKVKNISSRTIEQMFLTYKVSGYESEFSLPFPVLNLGPGEEATFHIGEQKLSSGSNAIIFGAKITWGVGTSASAIEAPVFIEWPIKGTWEIQTSQGKLSIIYRETDSAKGKLRFTVDKESRTMFLENRLNEPILVEGLLRFTFYDGKVRSGKAGDDFGWIDGEIETRGKFEQPIDINNSSGTSMIELWYEVK